MNIKYVIILFVVALLIGCNFERPAPCVVEVNKVLGEVAAKISNKYSINNIGTRVSIPGCEFRGIGLDFQYYGEISEDEIEKILFDIAYELLERVNNNSVLKPQMVEYPFTLKRIVVTLFLRKKDGEKIFYPEPMSVSLTSGKFYHLAQLKETLSGKYIKEYPASESKYYRGDR